MLNRRAYSVVCPCCRNIVEVRPPDSLVAKGAGLVHRCTWCRRMLATTIYRSGCSWIADVLVIGPSDRTLELDRPRAVTTGPRNETLHS